DHEHATAETLALVRDCGFSAVFLECREDVQDVVGLELGEFSRECRREGVECYAVPCGYGGVLTTPSDLRSVFLRLRPGARQIDSRGRPTDRACPNDPEYLDWFAARMADLAELLACDGLLWNEPSFFYSRGIWACRCVNCQRVYESEYDEEMPAELSYRVLNVRQRSITIFLLSAAAAIKRVNRRGRSLVLAAPGLAHEQLHLGADHVTGLLDSSAVDGVALRVDWPTSYVGMEETVARMARPALMEAEMRGKEVLIWLKSTARPQDRLIETLRFASRLGIPGVVLADYDALIGDPNFDSMRPRLLAAVAAAAGEAPAAAPER
ncbi:MAG: hypothetical protein ACE5JM_09000, partial [Armatimonadota bacterium]